MPRYFELARLASRSGRLEQALDWSDSCLERNGRGTTGRAISRSLCCAACGAGRGRAAEIATGSLALDPMEYGRTVGELPARWRRPISSSWRGGNAEIAHGACARLCARRTVGRGPGAARTRLAASLPLRAYYLGWILAQSGQTPGGAGSLPARPPPCRRIYCFPNRLEDVLALESGHARQSAGRARALPAGQSSGMPTAAMTRRLNAGSVPRKLDPGFPTVHRNLGLAYFNKRHDPQAALAAYERAFALDPADGRVFFELDQLYKRLNHAPGGSGWRAWSSTPSWWNSAMTCRSNVSACSTCSGSQSEAYRAADEPHLPPLGRRRGQGHRAVRGQPGGARPAGALARRAGAARRSSCWRQAQVYPHNLGEGKLHGAQENHIFYYLGCAYAGAGRGCRTPGAASSAPPAG